MSTNILMHLTLTQYEKLSSQTDQFAKSMRAVDNLRYGFFGEVGGLLAAVKKASREAISHTQAHTAEEELGDALWYLAALSRHAGVDFTHVGAVAINDLQRLLDMSVTGDQVGDLQFSEIDGLLAYQKKNIPESTAKLLYDLAGYTGTLFAVFDEASPKMAVSHPEEHFGALLAQLGLVAASYGLKLERIAQLNLAKIASRWRQNDTPYFALFDAGFPEYEQLPREFAIEFIERSVGAKKLVVQQLREVNIGDPLTDNRADADDYRFHDVFHLAYVAHLGWSPVIRSLLKLKRKSHSSTDENEDGARAMIIEEGIATWIFNYARDRENFFLEVPEGKLEYSLLKQVQSMIAGFEVDQCPLWQWEKAILSGFEVFRQLKVHRGGIVTVDMNAHSITYENQREFRG